MEVPKQTLRERTAYITSRGIMKLNLRKELAAMDRMTVGEVQQRYAELCGESARSRHRQHLIHRIVWRLQANAEGGLSERALRRAGELANVADARVTPPRTADNGQPWCGGTRTNRLERRLPAPGAAITREYRGRSIVVTVLPDGSRRADASHGSTRTARAFASGGASASIASIRRVLTNSTPVERESVAAPPFPVVLDTSFSERWRLSARLRAWAPYIANAQSSRMIEDETHGGTRRRPAGAGRTSRRTARTLHCLDPCPTGR